MSRPYGSGGTPNPDFYRGPVRVAYASADGAVIEYETARTRRAYGLRSESSPDGWYAAQQERATRPRRPRPPRNGPVTSNMPRRDPAVQAELDRLERIRLAEEAEEIAREQALEDRRAAWRQANRIGDVDS